MMSSESNKQHQQEENCSSSDPQIQQTNSAPTTKPARNEASEEKLFSLFLSQVDGDDDEEVEDEKFVMGNSFVDRRRQLMKH